MRTSLSAYASLAGLFWAVAASAQTLDPESCPLIENVVANALLTVEDRFSPGGVLFPQHPGPAIIVPEQYDIIKFASVRQAGIAVLTPMHFQIVSTGLVTLEITEGSGDALGTGYPIVMVTPTFDQARLDALGDAVRYRESNGIEMVMLRLTLIVDSLGIATATEAEDGETVSISTEATYIASPVTDLILNDMDQSVRMDIFATAECGVEGRTFFGDMSVELQTLTVENPENGRRMFVIVD